MAEKRFQEVYTEGHLNGNKILVDTETGVQYLYSWNGGTGGITPLLNKDGKPLILEDLNE